jgi:hypothetical protein
LIDQLANRYYVQASKSKIKLESKKEAKANGHPSPDRADATVLAFTDIQAPLFSLSTEYVPEKSNNIRSASSMTQEEILNMMEAFKFREFEQLNNPTKLPKGKELNCSMRELININSGAEDNREARLEELNEQLKRWKNN